MKSEYIILIVIGGLFIYFLISYFIYRRVFRTDNSKQPSGLVNQEAPFFSSSWQWYMNIPKETISIHSYDNVKLSAVYIPSYDEKSNNIAILCHGYHSLNSDMAVIAKMYSELGFRILMPDARGHGLSKGVFSSFGHYERYDLKRWIQYILRTHGATDNILLHGVSMGAATVLLSTGMELPTNVKMVVADSPFTNGLSLLSRSLKPRILNIFIPGISAITYYLHRFVPGQINVVKAVKKAKIPIFIFHGEQDTVCPISMSRKLISVSQAPFKELYQIPKAKHAEGYIIDKLGIELRLQALISTYFILPKNAIQKKK
ncbi:MAG: alpha/beta fold hydrolase [Candidatus Izemoplasmatales bacterium]|nr:alpha/beta fold hydrolase [Candidatus Izemoplasmatales bacterium]